MRCSVSPPPLSTRISSGLTRVVVFQIRNDSRSGGTVGPMLSERLGVPAIDMSICQMSMHSIRAMTGAKDPGLGECQQSFELSSCADRWIGVQYMEGFFRHYQTVSSLIQADY